jgi:hypothetical protein
MSVVRSLVVLPLPPPPPPLASSAILSLLLNQNARIVPMYYSSRPLVAKNQQLISYQYASPSAYSPGPPKQVQARARSKLKSKTRIRSTRAVFCPRKYASSSRCMVVVVVVVVRCGEWQGW